MANKLIENTKKIITELLDTADPDMLCFLIKMYHDILVLEANVLKLKGEKNGEEVQTEKK